MNSLWLVFAAFVIVVVQSDKLDSGPQTFIEKTPTEQKPQKRYATKEVVVYLTPSQIRAIQEGKGYVSAEPIDEAEISEENQEELEQQPGQDDIYELSPLQINSEEEQPAPSSIPVDEPNFEQTEGNPHISWLYRPEEKKFIPLPEDAFAYWRYYPQIEAQSEEAQLETEENKKESEEAISETPQPQQQRFRLVPYEHSSEKNIPSTMKITQGDALRERWLRLLELNRSQLNKQLSITEKVATATTTTTTELPKAEREKIFDKLRFSSKYNDQKQAIENEERRKSLAEKQKATAREEAKTPVVIRKEVTIRKKQETPIIKHIKVPTPVLVPIPEPFEVKVPHPFPVPLEIFRPISNPAAKPRVLENKKPAVMFRIEDEKSQVSTAKKPLFPSEKASKSERRVSGDGKKDVSVEIPFRQGQPERITIIRHIWEN